MCPPHVSDYTLLSEVDAIFHRPSPYVGEVSPITRTDLFPAVADGSQSALSWSSESVTTSPAVEKLFGELLDNAVDASKRDSSVKSIEVFFSSLSGVFSISNDGSGIPTSVHPEHGLRVCEMIFSHLHSGSNFGEDRGAVQGQNGLGAKLSLIFSQRSSVEVIDPASRERWVQVAASKLSNLRQKVSALPKTYSSKKGLVKIQIEPHYPMFSTGIEPSVANDHGSFADLGRVLFRTLCDAALHLRPGVRLLYRDSGAFEASALDVTKLVGPFPTSNRSQISPYLSSMFGCSSGASVWVWGCRGWKIVVSEQHADRPAICLSFANGCRTRDGGTHLDCVKMALGTAILNAFKQPHSGVHPYEVVRHLCVAVDVAIDNPAYSSQCKDRLTNPRRYLPPLTIGASEASSLFKRLPGIRSLIDSLQAVRASKTLARSDGRKVRSVSVDGLKDANLAGTRRSGECTLLICEGDSAKQLALAGMSSAPGGNDLWGALSLRGKVKNVAKTAKTDASGEVNAEIQKIITSMGLKQAMTFSDSDKGKLRYGRLVLFTDQDPDGDHICGLLLTLLKSYFPSFVESGMASRFITPVVVATPRGAHNEAAVRRFYSLQDKDAWIASLGDEQQASYAFAYYKGLGTSTNKEGKEYFRSHKELIKPFVADSAYSQAIDLAFGPDSRPRKEWLQQPPNCESLRVTDSKWPISSFVHGPVRQYSLHALSRAIPNIVDGLIPSRRKVVFELIRSGGTSGKVKVIELTGAVTKSLAYHHGDASLNAVIVNLAQGYVGRLNVPLLLAKGQFGSRTDNPTVHAAPRYLHTAASPILAQLFTADDAAVSRQQNDDGKSIEPVELHCALPLILINGVQNCIATGFSSSIPPHDPTVVLEYIQARLRGCTERLPRLRPWYKGFKGTVEEKASSSSAGESGKVFELRGCWKRTSADRVTVTELPPGTWTNEFVARVVRSSKEKEGKGKKRAHASSSSLFDAAVEWGASTGVDQVHLVFTLLDPSTTDATIAAALDQAGMSCSVGYTNMHMFVPHSSDSHDCVLRRFDSPEHILDEWLRLRQEHVAKRKEYQLAALKKSIRAASIKTRFCDAVRSGSLRIYDSTPTGGVAPVQDQELDRRIRAAMESGSDHLSDDELDVVKQLGWRAISSASVASALQSAVKREESLYRTLESTSVSELVLENAKIFTTRAA